MNAQLQPAPRYAGHSDAEKAARIRHELQFETRLRRAGVQSIRWKCTHCRAGSVTISGHYSVQGRLLSSSGLCTTPDCLDWGN